MTKYSKQCLEVLAKLAQQKNVLLSGPPATGKTTLMNEVIRAFQEDPAALMAAAKAPVLEPTATPPLPPNPSTAFLLSAILAPARKQRLVFHSPFHQGFHPRDFLTGLAADVGTPGGFTISEGTLYRASEHALGADCASLLVIDELNRGPAVQIFGPTIAAIEADKRLDDNNAETLGTVRFQHLSPKTKKMEPYSLPAHLYILAAYNQVDSSVQPLDTAFLRRWSPYAVDPDEEVLRELYKLNVNQSASASVPGTSQDVAYALLAAWKVVNSRISDLRSGEYCIGHGVLMRLDLSTTERALETAADAFNRLLQHIGELFFGEPRQLAYALNAGTNSGDLYRLDDRVVDRQSMAKLLGPRTVSAANVYAIAQFVAR